MFKNSVLEISMHNPVKRLDRQNINQIIRRIAEEKARVNGLNLSVLSCPPPLSRNCFLLIDPAFDKSDYQMMPYNTDGTNSLTPIFPQGKFAFVCLYNDTAHKIEFRCGLNKNGTGIHLILSGYAPGVECAGELEFGEAGKLISWNLQSGSYSTSVEYAERARLPQALLLPLQLPVSDSALAARSHHSNLFHPYPPKKNPSSSPAATTPEKPRVPDLK